MRTSHKPRTRHLGHGVKRGCCRAAFVGLLLLVLLLLYRSCTPAVAVVCTMDCAVGVVILRSVAVCCLALQ